MNTLNKIRKTETTIEVAKAIVALSEGTTLDIPVFARYSQSYKNRNIVSIAKDFQITLANSKNFSTSGTAKYGETLKIATFTEISLELAKELLKR